MFAYTATKRYYLGNTGLAVSAKTFTFAKDAIIFVVGRTHNITVDMEQHVLSQVIVLEDDELPDTKDGKVILNNCLFEERPSFLNFCVKNHYQFDTLRQAKYSSLMILHHLRDLTVLTSDRKNNSCSSISHEDADQSSVCDIDQDKDSSPAVCHVTKMGRETQVTQLTKLSPATIKELLHVLKHASLCHPTKDRPCSYPNTNCLKIKKLFVHVKNCTVRGAGGCEPCNKAWLGLMLHSKGCRESNCTVPRCMDLRKYADHRGQTRDGSQRFSDNSGVQLFKSDVANRSTMVA